MIFPAQASGDEITKAVDKAIPNRLELGDWLVASGIVIAAVGLAYVVHRVVMRLDRRSDSDSRTVQAVARLSSYMVVVAGATIALETLEIDLAPLLAGLGIVGIVVALAMQDIVANYFAGILIGIRKPFRTGDEIASQEHEGVVEDLNFRYTKLRAFDGTRVLLPNAGVFGNPLVNYTANGSRRSTIEVGVGYGTDPGLAKRVLLAAAAECTGIVAESPAPAVWVESLGESALQLRLMVWHGPGMRDALEARDAVVVAAWQACERASIDLPYPHRVVEITTSSVPGTASSAGP